MGSSRVTCIHFVLLEEHAFFWLKNDSSLVASFLIIDCFVSNEYIMILISLFLYSILI